MSREGDDPSIKEKARWWRCIDRAQTLYEMDAEEAKATCLNFVNHWFDERHGTWMQVKIKKILKIQQSFHQFS